MQNAIGTVNAVEKPVDLRAKFASGERMVGVAAQLHRNGRRSRMVDGDRPSARVGAIVVASTMHGLSRNSFESTGTPSPRLRNMFKCCDADPDEASGTRSVMLGGW